MAKNPNLKCYESLSQKLPKIENRLAKLAKARQGEIRPNSELVQWLKEASALATEASLTEIAETHILGALPKELVTFLGDGLPQMSAESQIPDFLVNLNELCLDGKIDPVIGREQEIRSLLEILSRKTKNNPILLGEAGVGKTAVVEGLAHHITQKDVPEKFRDHTIYRLDISGLMAGTQYRGSFEKQIQKLRTFVKDACGKAIIFFDEIHMLIGAGKTEGGIDGANLLKPALARGELPCIGATTYQEYQKYIMSDSALDRRFRPVQISEPSAEATIEIILGLKDRLEAHHGLSIENEAIYSAVFLSAQYVWDRNFPDKALDLIDEACAAKKFSIESMPTEIISLEEQLRQKKTLAKTDRVDNELVAEIYAMEEECDQKKSQWQEDVKQLKEFAALKKQIDVLTSKQELAEKAGDYEAASRLKYAEIPELEKKLGSYNIKTSLTKDDVARVLARRTGIGKEKILTSKQKKILELEPFLQRKVFGQSHQLTEIAEILMASYAGLSDNSRPLGSFLLTGPSGVGKTETAKSLCEFFFENQEKLIRFDLSEYSEKHSVAKLIGAPSGYVGYDDGGQLTEAVRKQPYAVILFDEVEKAHSDFCDILLQILDDGCLTDNKGRRVSFCQCCIILTSNSQAIENELKPELIGRLDAILTYDHLDKPTLKKLVASQLADLNESLKPKKITVRLSSKVEELVLKNGFHTDYGARPLKSYFKKLITRPIARKILEEELPPSIIRFDVSEHGEVSLEVQHR